MTIAHVKALIEQALAAVNELEFPPAQPPVEAGYVPPALTGAVRIIDRATTEHWPGPRDRPWSKWDYLTGLRILGVGGRLEYVDPIYPMETHAEQFEADVCWLAASDRGRAILANMEDRVGVDAKYLALAGFKPVERLPDGTLREYD